VIADWHSKPLCDQLILLLTSFFPNRIRYSGFEMKILEHYRTSKYSIMHIKYQSNHKI